MTYPSVLSGLATPQPTDRLNSPSHSQLHQNENSALLEIERFVGTDSSAVGTLVNDIRSPNSDGGGHVQTAIKGGTGQTIFTKGDLLVGQSSSVLSKLAVGADTLVLLADASQATGVRWGSPAPTNVQSFISSGVWIRPAGITATSKVFVELWGGGGGGGAASVNATAGGGGGGSYVNGWYTASIMSSSLRVDVGAGGPGVLANGVGNVGGITVFDPVTSMLTAYGGGGGTGAGGATNSFGGNGGGLFMNGFSNTNNIRPETSIYGGYGGIPNGTLQGPGGPGNYVGAAGGGGGGAPGASVNGNALSALFGGSGGGGVTSSFMGTGGPGLGGGGGQRGSIVGGGTVAKASIRGGGGGAGYGTNATSGSGGDGFAIVTTFL